MRKPKNRKNRPKTCSFLVGRIIPTIRNKPKLVELLERIGTVQILSEDGIYRVEISGVGPRGVRKATYNKLKKWNEHAETRK